MPTVDLDALAERVREPLVARGLIVTVFPNALMVSDTAWSLYVDAAGAITYFDPEAGSVCLTPDILAALRVLVESA